MPKTPIFEDPGNVTWIEQDPAYCDICHIRLEFDGSGKIQPWIYFDPATTSSAYAAGL